MATSFCRSPSLQVSCILFFVSSFLLLLPLSKSLYSDITRFDADATNILYSGDKVPSIGILESNITHANSFRKQMNYINRVGNKFIYADTVQIRDRKSGNFSDFTSHFTFIIDSLGQSSYGHGLPFFLAPVGFQNPLTSAGACLGLFNITYANSFRKQMIVIEFDSLSNPKWNSPKNNVGIKKNSIGSSNYTFWNATIHRGDLADVLVSYNATTQILRLSFGSGDDPRENTSLLYQVDVDLREVLPERVIVEFSACTSTSHVERHILQHWEFNSCLSIKTDNNSSEWKLLSVVSAVPIGVLVLGGIVVACGISRRRIRKPTQNSIEAVTLTSMMNDIQNGAGPKRFSHKDLASATDNFSEDMKLGAGGFGCVYKGYLPSEGMAVAVKKNSHVSKQGKNEYITEVKIISHLSHRNLVQLIGWCHDHSQYLLVYEFMPNGSLDSHLFGKKNPLEWAVRYKIVMGLASALQYLHEGWEQCVVHRDIKTSNIMLDSRFNVKLGDFGLARLRDHDLGPQTTGLAGTLGYMAPEYVITGRASKESDVYSFGVVALEIVCGRKVTDSIDSHSYLGLVEWVWDLLGKNELLLGVDQKLNDKFDAKQVECLMRVGLWSAHPDPSLRPSIRQAIQVLKFEGAAPNLPMKMPVAMYYAAPQVPEVNSGCASLTYTSVDLVR